MNVTSEFSFTNGGEIANTLEALTDLRLCLSTVMSRNQRSSKVFMQDKSKGVVHQFLR